MSVMENQKLKWTAEEEKALLAGIEKHGAGKWRNILRDPECADQLINRSSIDLKDKWRNLLCVVPGAQVSEDNARPIRVNEEGVTLAIAGVATTATPSPNANSSSSPSVSLPRSAYSEFNVDDSSTMALDMIRFANVTI